MLRYVLRDLVRNPRRTLASVAGVALAVGLVSGIAFFVDSSSAQMTQRAIAPVVIDMQAGVNNPLASPLALTESVTPAQSLGVGQTVTVSLAVTNTGTRPATAVVVKDTAPASVGYTAGTTTLGGVKLPDAPATGDTATTASPLNAGVSVGTLAPGASATATYAATVRTALAGASSLQLAGTVQSAEEPAPAVANAVPTTNLTRMISGIQSIPGIAGAQPFASADLPAGSLRLGGSTVNAALKVVAFNPEYLTRFPLIHLTSGRVTKGTAALSQPAADLLGSSPSPGTAIQLSVPGRVAPLTLPLSAVADFSQASQLFVSRSPDTQGDFVAAPYVLAVDMATFQQAILPALRVDAAAQTPMVKTPPVIEVHVGIARSTLASDPSTAAVTTQGLRRTVERLAPGEITVADNLSDALLGARTDSILAKVLFIFLGLPGVLLAAYLSRYAGGLLAQAQRRERATLRARGLRPNSLLRALAYSTAAIATAGSVVGLGLGFGALALLFRDSSSLHGSTSSYVQSVGISVLVAVLTTTLALYLPGRRALMREVVDERREMESSGPPSWLRARVDLILLTAAGTVALVTYLTGGYKPSTASEAQSVSLSFYVLLAPLLFWVGATLLAVRGLLMIAARRRGRVRAPGFQRRLVGTTLALGILRRPQAAASGVIALSLAVAFGVSLMIFVSTYQAEKLADARFVMGGDVRVTAGANQVAATDITSRLRVEGVQAVTPTAQTSSLVVGTEKRTLVAVDPRSFDTVAHINSSFLNGMSPSQAMDALAADPDAVLIDQEIARTFNVQPGDPVRVQVPNRATGKTVPYTFKAVATFTRFPGFPQGVDFVANIVTYQTVAATPAPDTYLIATDGTDGTNASVAAALASGPAKGDTLLVDTTATAVNNEQSTLSALNLSGLGRLETVYTVLMSSLGIGIFGFGILLQRRKEHVTMRAMGMRMRQVQGLIIGEAGMVSALSLLIGGLVGTAMALMSVQILQPVFTVPPSTIDVPAATLGLLAGLVVAAMVGTSLIAGQTLRRTHLVEVLRDE